MTTDDFFWARLDQLIDLRHPLEVLARRLPWADIEVYLAPSFIRRNRPGQLVESDGLVGSSTPDVGAGISPASLLYLKHAINFSDEQAAERCVEHVVWQYFSGLDYCEPRLPCVPPPIGSISQSHR